MHLTSKELEVMVLLWESNVPMTVAEILNVSENRTWSTNSIFVMMTKLEKKGAVDYKLVASVTKPARVYSPTLTYEEYLAKSLVAKEKSRNMQMDIDVFIKLLKEEVGKTETSS